MKKNIWPRYGGLHWWFLSNYSCSNITLTISVSTLPEIFKHIIQHQVTSWGTRHTQHTHIFCYHLTYAMKSISIPNMFRTWNWMHIIPIYITALDDFSYKSRKFDTITKSYGGDACPSKTCEKNHPFQKEKKTSFLSNILSQGINWGSIYLDFWHKSQANCR